MTTRNFIKQQKSKLVYLKGNTDYLVILGVVFIPSNTPETGIYFKVLLTNGMHAYLDCNYNLYLFMDMNMYDLKSIYSTDFKNGEYIKDLINKPTLLLQTNIEFVFTESYLYTEIFQQFIQEPLKIEYFPKLNLQIPICIRENRVNSILTLVQNLWKITKNFKKSRFTSIQDLETTYFLNMVATLKQYISNEVQNIIDTKLDNVDYIPNVYMTIIETLREISTVKESDEVLNKILEERLSSFIPKVSKKKNDGKDKFLSSLIAEAKLKGQDTTGYKYYFPPKMQAAMDALIAEKITLTNHTITANTTLPDMNEPLNDIQVHDMNEPTDIIVEETHIVQADPNDNFFLNDL